MEILVFYIILPRQGNLPISREIIGVLRSLSREYLPNSDIVIRHDFLLDRPSINFTVYTSHVSWANIFNLLFRIKGILDERDLHISSIVFSSENRVYPPLQALQAHQGIWLSPNCFRENETRLHLIEFLRDEEGHMAVDDWFFIPFAQEPAQNDDNEYEPCEAECVRHFGHLVNGTVTRREAPVGFRIKMIAGSRISEYISSMYNIDLGKENNLNQERRENNLGGFSVLMTTLLQMNDKLPLVNHYSEKLRQSEALNFFSLSALNLELTKERDETDISKLVSLGKIIISNIELGV